SDLDVRQDGTTYAISFINGLAETDIALLSADGTALVGGTVSVDTSVAGGVSTPVGQPLTFTSANWWQPQTVFFAVDDRAAGLPKGADIQNSAVASCVLDTSSSSDPLPCLATPPFQPISGQVAGGGVS